VGCEIGIGETVARPPLPHHRRCGSAYGVSGLCESIEQARETQGVEVGDGERVGQGRTLRQVPGAVCPRFVRRDPDRPRVGVVSCTAVCLASIVRSGIWKQPTPDPRNAARSRSTAVSYFYLLLDVPARARSARFAGPESGARYAQASSPWPAPFSPSPPLPVPRLCSATSAVLWSGRASLDFPRSAVLSPADRRGISRFPRKMVPCMLGVFDRAGQCRLIWLILHQGVRYEEHGPAVTKQSRQARTARMIRQLRKLAYQVELPNSQPANSAGR
jgi:hypothetical protein